MLRAILTLFFALAMSFTAAAQDSSLEGFHKRFKLERDADGKLVAIKLKKAVTRFTILPFIEQLKAELKREQELALSKNAAELEAEVDELLYDMGIDPYDKTSDGMEESRRFKESILNIRRINVDAAFAQLNQTDFWKEFEAKLQEAFLFVDPTVLANLHDARFFFKRQVTYRVIIWALQEAAKRFSNIPVLNIASFVIVRVHEMMLEQRHFHHNMLLHYFEVLPEDKFGMTKEEVDRAVSSIYEYRIDAVNVPESNRAARDWLSYGMNNFYMQVRAGNSKVRNWQSPLQNRFRDVKKIDFAFAEVSEKNVRRIYHLHASAHQFTQGPAMAYDYSNPNRIRRNRALMTLGGVALGFLNIPDFIKSNVQTFIKSMYVEQVRLEGALVGYFERTGDTRMLRSIFAQRANFYIVE
jgi:hypothetical protein